MIFEQEDYDKLPQEPTDEELDMLDLAYGLTDTYVNVDHFLNLVWGMKTLFVYYIFVTFSDFFKIICICWLFTLT